MVSRQEPNGILGWIKQGDSEQAKKAYDFFRSLPAEPLGIAVQIPTTLAAASRQKCRDRSGHAERRSDHCAGDI